MAEIKTRTFEQQVHNSRLINQQGIRHPLLRLGNMDRLYSLAIAVKKIVKKQAPDSPWTIVSLGQSAAWLVYCMKLLDTNQSHNKNRYGHIAFSKHFFELNPDSKMLYRTSNPTHNQVTAYQEYLRKTGYFSRNSKRFLAIIEFSCYTRGLRSFHEVAQPLLPKNMTYIITQPVLNHLMFEGAQLLQTCTESEDDLLYDLRNSDQFNDRRVMNFPASSWGETNPLTFETSDEVALIETHIADFLDHRDYSIDSSSDSDDIV